MPLKISDINQQNMVALIQSKRAGQAEGREKRAARRGGSGDWLNSARLNPTFKLKSSPPKPAP